jgi:hypothetical protein
MSLPPIAQTLVDRIAERELALGCATNDLTERYWQLVAALVRQVVPDATGVRLYGDYTENGMRLSLATVLRDGEPVRSMDPGPFDQLSEDLSDSLLWLAEHEDDSALHGEHSYDLPAPTPAESAMVASITLPEGQLRVWERDAGQNELGRMYVLDVHGVNVQVWQRSHGLYVHVGGDADSQPVSTVLLVEVNDGGESEHSL